MSFIAPHIRPSVRAALATDHMSADLEIRHQNIALALGKVVEAAEFNTPALARLAFASMAEVLAECDPFDEIEVGALVALYAVKVGQ